jgi:hypothetical protein
MWCEENSLNAIKSRGFSDALIANQRRYIWNPTTHHQFFRAAGPGICGHRDPCAA